MISLSDVVPVFCYACVVLSFVVLSLAVLLSVCGTVTDSVPLSSFVVACLHRHAPARCKGNHYLSGRQIIVVGVVIPETEP